MKFWWLRWKTNMCIDSALLYSIHAYMYISKTLLFILITIYTHVSFSAQPSKFHYVIGGQLQNEIQSAHILETSMSAKKWRVELMCMWHFCADWRSKNRTWCRKIEHAFSISHIRCLQRMCTSNFCYIIDIYWHDKILI